MVTTHHIEHFLILGYAINAINLEHDVCTLQVDNKRKQNNNQWARLSSWGKIKTRMTILYSSESFNLQSRLQLLSTGPWQSKKGALHDRVSTISISLLHFWVWTLLNWFVDHSADLLLTWLKHLLQPSVSPREKHNTTPQCPVLNNTTNVTFLQWRLIIIIIIRLIIINE